MLPKTFKCFSIRIANVSLSVDDCVIRYKEENYSTTSVWLREAKSRHHLITNRSQTRSCPYKPGIHTYTHSLFFSYVSMVFFLKSTFPNKNIIQDIPYDKQRKFLPDSGITNMMKINIDMLCLIVPSTDLLIMTIRRAATFRTRKTTASVKYTDAITSISPFARNLREAKHYRK